MFSRQGLHPSVEEYTEEWYDQLIKVGVGDGIAVMQRVPCEEDLVRFIPLEDEMALRPVNLMWAQGRDRSPAARYLSEFLLGYSRDLPIM